MSGIRTGARFAVLDVRGGLDLDAYDTWAALATAVAYSHAIGGRDRVDLTSDLSELPGPEADAALCDRVLARADALHAATRDSVIRAYDPKRLRPPEVWPFRYDNKTAIYADRYYGFYDAGGVLYQGAGMVGAGGWATSEACVTALMGLRTSMEDDVAGYCSTDSTELGVVACCVLTGRQYVDALYKVGGGYSLEEWGGWSEPPAGMQGCGKCDDDPALCAWHQQCQAEEEKKHASDATELEYVRGLLALMGVSGPIGPACSPLEDWLRRGAAAADGRHQQARIHDTLKGFLSKRDQGRVMGTIRRELGWAE
jgi:hypothetical protein